MPFREAMQVCFAELATLPPETARAMVIIVHEESYPSWVYTKWVMESVRQSGVRIYAISLAKRSSGERLGLFLRTGRALRDGMVWMIEGFMEALPPTRRSTSNMLKILSASSGGRFFTAGNEFAVLACAGEITAGICEFYKKDKL
jgi:hypothetical protein